MAHVSAKPDAGAVMGTAEKTSDMVRMMKTGGGQGMSGMMGGSMGNMGAMTSGMASRQMGGMGMGGMGMGSGQMGGMGMGGMGMGSGQMGGMGMGMGGGQMGRMMMGPMMGGMGGGQMMANMPMMAECAEMMGKSAVAAGVAASASSTGRSFVHRLLRNPWVLFGVGVAAGFLVHKYRKEIIACGAGVTEKSKEFVGRQTENVKEWVAGYKEGRQESGETKAEDEG